jgi:RNA polymerase sigma-70 factor (ECF subfamily)
MKEQKDTEKELENLQPETAQEPQDAPELTSAADSGDGDEDVATAEEMEAIPAEKLREWIAGLPEMRRAVFDLYCIDGYSHKEIGKLLGISETGSTSMLAKARKQLKEKIRDYLKEQDR